MAEHASQTKDPSNTQLIGKIDHFTYTKTFRKDLKLENKDILLECAATCSLHCCSYTSLWPQWDFSCPLKCLVSPFKGFRPSTKLLPSSLDWLRPRDKET